jgi:hypothetical protein
MQSCPTTQQEQSRDSQEAVFLKSLVVGQFEISHSAFASTDSGMRIPPVAPAKAAWENRSKMPRWAIAALGNWWWWTSVFLRRGIFLRILRSTIVLRHFPDVLSAIRQALMHRIVAFWDWAATWNWWAILVSGALGGILRIGEYAVTIALISIAALGISSKIIHSTGMHGASPAERRFYKGVGLLAVLLGFIYLAGVSTLNAVKDNSWSNLPHLWAYAQQFYSAHIEEAKKVPIPAPAKPTDVPPSAPSSPKANIPTKARQKKLDSSQPACGSKLTVAAIADLNESGGVKDKATVKVTRGSSASGATTRDFETTGQGSYEVDMDMPPNWRPEVLDFRFSDRIITVERYKPFPHSLRDSGHPLTIVNFTDDGFTIDDEGCAGISYNVTWSRGSERLALVRYQPQPYEAGQKLRVRMFVDNKTTEAISVYGRTVSNIVEGPPSAYEERKKLEDRIWEERSTIHHGKVSLRIPVMAPGTFFVLLEGGNPLSSDEISTLGDKSVMYLMTEIWDSKDRVLREACFHTEPKSEALTFCAEHNK